MNKEQKYYFILGAIYSQAQQMKDEGYFKDLTIDMVASLLIDGLFKDAQIKKVLLN